jgi:DMSO/TMAO reductase YedYZ molybdopterin-dependent catalytic subunit
MKEEIISEKGLKRKTLFAFVFFFIAIISVVSFWLWFKNSPKEQGVQPALRTGFEVNERLFSATANEFKLVRTYPKTEAVQRVRVNGNLGMRGELDTATWRMHIIKRNGDTLRFSLNDVMRLPKTEVVFDFKCIEGWSQKTWWGGVKTSDFIKHYGLEEDAKFNYAGIATPDKKYYVGLDMPSFLHPQTLLCYEMNGKPLPSNQGYPLRLIIPVKYGIKHIKRIGTVYFSNQRPPDYWAEKGYDYHSGH